MLHLPRVLACLVPRLQPLLWRVFFRRNTCGSDVTSIPAAIYREFLLFEFNWITFDHVSRITPRFRNHIYGPCHRSEKERTLFHLKDRNSLTYRSPLWPLILRSFNQMVVGLLVNTENNDTVTCKARKEAIEKKDWATIPTEEEGEGFTRTNNEAVWVGTGRRTYDVSGQRIESGSGQWSQSETGASPEERPRSDAGKARQISHLSRNKLPEAGLRDQNTETRWSCLFAA